MTTRWRKCSGAGIASALLLILVAAPVSAKSEADERAAKRVEAMANFLAKAPRLSVTADCSYDVVQDSGQKIEFGEVRAITLRRPDRARIEATRRDGVRRGLIFDGKQIVAFDLDQKVYATVAKAGTTDAAFDYFKHDLDMRLPLSELFSTTLPEKISDMLGSARLVGEETINGVATDHIALRGDTADLQFWIARNGDPLPQRLVITYRLAEGQPQYEANFRDWNLSPEVADSVFTFTPAEGAQEIPFLVPKPENQP
jgi:hypothetical protein